MLGRALLCTDETEEDAMALATRTLAVKDVQVKEAAGGDLRDAGPAACAGGLDGEVPPAARVAVSCEGDPPDDAHMLGVFGEEIATQYLQGRGYTLLERNYRTVFGEADIVFRDGDEVVLVEVKTRLGLEARPEEAVDERKTRRYRNITLAYLGANAWADRVRFDVVAVNVVTPEDAVVHHFAGVCLWEG